MAKPTRWKKINRSRMNVPRGTSRATMVRNSADCIDTRNNYWIPTLIQRWIIPLPMLLPMGGWKLKMMSIRYIRWSTITVYLHLCLTRNYRISWLGSWNARNGIWVAGLAIWKNHKLNKIWRWFSLFSTLINCIVVVTSWRRWRSTYTIDSITWRRSSSSTDKISFTPRLTLLESYR